MKNYFSLDENFDDIIKNNLKTIYGVNKVYSINLNTTGWTNIVFKVKADNGNYYFIVNDNQDGNILHLAINNSYLGDVANYEEPIEITNIIEKVNLNLISYLIRKT